jgi:hypothetical protein
MSHVAGVAEWVDPRIPRVLLQSLADTASVNMGAEAALSTGGLGFLLVFIAPLGADLLIFWGSHKKDPTSFIQDATPEALATCVRYRGALACTDLHTHQRS